jgi:hypothetical protein
LDHNDKLVLGIEFCLILVMFVGLVICPMIYENADSSGIIPHNEETTISAQPTWLVGESKDCVSYPLLTYAQAAPLGRPVGYAVDRINCDNGPQHRIRIKFFGRLEQPEYSAVQWKCTREEGGFTCYEISALRSER